MLDVTKLLLLLRLLLSSIENVVIGKESIIIDVIVDVVVVMGVRVYVIVAVLYFCYRS